MSGQILVVEDDEAIREVIRYALEDEGYTVATAVDGLDALDRLAAFTPDLVILDLRMPRMDGATFAQEYRGRGGPRAPILLLTAAQDADTLGAEVAADAALNKPFDLTDLLDLVERTIGAARREDCPDLPSR